MYLVSEAFSRTIRQSHDVAVSVSVWSSDQFVQDLAVLSGSVTIDSRRAVRRSCEIEIADETGRGFYYFTPITLAYSDLDTVSADYNELVADYPKYLDLLRPIRFREISEPPPLVPATAGDLLTPFGNELRIYRGIKFPDGSTELVPLGVFVITRTEVNDDGNQLTIKVSGDDRSVRISRARWTKPYEIASGTNLATAIQNILEDRWADVTCIFDPTSATTSKTILGLDTDNDPWQDAVRIAESAGLDLFFDGDGIARLRNLPDVTTGAINETYDEGTEGVTLSVTKSISSESTYNGVIVTGEGSDVTTAVRAEAWDDNPNSPTYRYGKFGEVPAFYSSSMITTVAQAQETATNLLNKYLGADEGIQFGMVVNPAHDTGDLIRLQMAATKIDKVLLIDQLTIPLSPTDTMSAIARTTQIYG